MDNVALVLAVNAALLATGFLVLWRVAQRLGDVSFIDAAWALGMVGLALATFVQAGTADPRDVLLVGLCALWGLRLGLHLLTRWRRLGPDPRYVTLVGDVQRERGWSFGRASALFVFAPQALFLFLVCLPVQLGQLGEAPLGPVAMAGGALCLAGITFEAIGDAQLARFRADPANQGRVLDTGLWRYTRHPNYFGDACAWWGLYLLACGAPLGVWALPGPLFLTWTLTRWSGAALLESRLKDSRPAYADYVARTSGFIPWPPRRRLG